MSIKVSWLAAVNSSEPGELFQQLDVHIIHLANFLFKVTWNGYICLKWSTINGSCLRETIPVGYPSMLHFCSVCVRVRVRVCVVCVCVCVCGGGGGGGGGGG